MVEIDATTKTKPSLKFCNIKVIGQIPTRYPINMMEPNQEYWDPSKLLSSINPYIAAVLKHCLSLLPMWL